jgi:hypothetical protein
MACAGPRPIAGVVRPEPGAPFLEALPGPMPGFGPYADYSDALSAACTVFLSKPNASVGDIKDPELAQRVSTEYCAWLYYTPEHQYQMSLLTDQSNADDLQKKRRTCRLPAFVDDPRFQSWDLKYVFALHNHPYGGPLSLPDMRQIVALANEHEWVVQTKRGKVPLAIVAFFAKPGSGEGTCGGFYQYTPETRDLYQFIQTNQGWRREDLGKVTWLDRNTFRLNKRDDP